MLQADRNSESSKATGWLRLSLSLLLALSLTGGALTACGKKGEEKDASAKEEQSGGDEDGKSTVSVTVAPVVKQLLNTTIRLPGELEAYRDVRIHAKVKGFIKEMRVDRGSQVKEGQVMVVLMAPELDAKVREAKAKIEAAKAGIIESQADIASHKDAVEEMQAIALKDAAEYQRLQEAAKEPGAVAGGELDAAEKNAESAKARVESVKQQLEAAKAMLEVAKGREEAAVEEYKGLKSMEDYLIVKAPFSGVVSERMVHEGSLVGEGEDDSYMLRLRQLSPLRLVIYVPEDSVAAVQQGDKLNFSVQAYPGQMFNGTLARIGESLKRETRTMPVELDVINNPPKLKPGMFAEVTWPDRRSYETTFVPVSAIGSNMDKSFVTLVKGGKAKTVQVQRGKTMGDLVEVFGDVGAGDQVVADGSEEIKDGTPVAVSRKTSSRD